ncbi:MAG: phage tail sheath subtilisin-like domain-containing protein [Acidobacteria bacterium]|nr:phage tail sheath subtilisin-like domain-containing protein [Acidobacteriota bacterium]
MPEYLAPGVYVEETSFRARSIEGVSTSTTAFAGPTLKGPVSGTPELITSFGDFERIYGGLDDLAMKLDAATDVELGNVNYIAHAVRAYFDNGGARLYVSRVFSKNGNSAGTATSGDVLGVADPDAQMTISSRVPGKIGNGRLTFRLAESPATVVTLSKAPTGSLLRTGGAGSPITNASITGGAPTFNVADNTKLVLSVDGGANQSITFHGVAAEAQGAALGGPVALDTAAKQTLHVVVDGVDQTLHLAGGAAVALADISDDINQKLRGGYCRLEGANKITIGSDRRGSAASVKVFANADLGFAADTDSPAVPANTVGDLAAVTLADIKTLLQGAAIKVKATVDGTGKLVLTADDKAGAASGLEVKADPLSAHAALGLPAATPATGKDGAAVKFYLKSANGDWADSGAAKLDLSNKKAADPADANGSDLLSLTVTAEDAAGGAITYEDAGFGADHPRYLANLLPAKPKYRSVDLENLYAVAIGSKVTGFSLLAGLMKNGTSRVVSMTSGDDGTEPTQKAYETALAEFEKLEDVSIVAGPGYSAYKDSQGIQGAIVSHAERQRAYRIAVLDARPGQELSEARATRGTIDSKYAAFYYPWVVVSNPLFRPGQDQIPREIKLPPSGFVCGIYARNDIERGVFKAPANETVRGALRFEKDITFTEQGALNPIGVNCLRYLSGRGYKLWGARTASSDPEWKYVNVRRYFNYLEASIDRGTQWAVFEPNGENLWANIRETIGSFLYTEWLSGALLGTTPEQAFFVRCDRSTMTQNDLDNGRLICLIGVAVVKPAEFVIFRIGQKTAEARS